MIKNREKLKNLKPKLPLTSFLRYYYDVKDELLMKHSEFSISKLLKIAGKQWNNLKKEKKNEYEESYKKSLDEYNLESEIWEKENIEKKVSKLIRNKRKVSIDENDVKIIRKKEGKKYKNNVKIDENINERTFGGLNKIGNVVKVK